MERQLSDNEIREILIERKRQERYAADEAKWNEISDWLEAFALVGFGFMGLFIFL